MAGTCKVPLKGEAMSFVSRNMKRFFTLSGGMIVREAIAILKDGFGQPPRRPGDRWTFDYIHLIITLPEGKYAILESSTDGEFQCKLNAAADKAGKTILDVPLADVPGLCQPCPVVEVTDNEAAVRTRCGGEVPSLAVVLGAGQPTGVFVRMERKGMFESRFPTQLFGEAVVFGRDEPGGERRECPHCNAEYGYPRPVPVGETWQYHCPHCDADLTDELS
jgi:hypothetical protein